MGFTERNWVIKWNKTQMLSIKHFLEVSMNCLLKTRTKCIYRGKSSVDM